MTVKTKCGVRLKWAGGEHDFDLGSSYVQRVLNGETGALPIEFARRGYPLSGGVLPGQFGDTPAACLKRFQGQVFSMTDVERIFELGLWGGGTPASDAFDLVDDYIKGEPLRANAILALDILAALFVGSK